MNTLYLNQELWDLTTDSFNNIALATEPYSLAQDAASAIQTFLGEVYYDTTIGLPYFQSILGYGVPLEYIRTQLINAALTVPDVASADVYFTGLTNRVLTGQVQVTSATGTISTAAFASALPTGSFTLDISSLDSEDTLG